MPTDNVVFDKLLVRSFSLDWLEVTWEVRSSTLDPQDFDWVIERSESPEGPWTAIAGPFQDRYRFIDNQVNLLRRWRQLYYRIVSTSKGDTSNVSISSAVTLAAEPDLIAQEIQMLERTVNTEFNGRRCYLFPVRTFGQYCPNCMDVSGRGSTYRKLRSNCLTCYDTQYVKGFFNPIELFIQIDPSVKSIQPLQTGETEQSNTSARMGNYPLLKPRDIIIEAENRRWRVTQVTPTERLRAVVRQEMQLHELVKGDIEFQLPVNVDSLRELEPSPERNFSNPQNLEDFENEAMLATLKAYGYTDDQ